MDESNSGADFGLWSDFSHWLHVIDEMNDILWRF